MNQQIEITLPENFILKNSSDDEEVEEYNPFQFKTIVEQYHSLERAFQKYYDSNDQKWVLVPKTKINIIRRGVKKVKGWLQYIKQEHSLFQLLRNENEALKQQIDNYKQIVSNIEQANQQKYDNLYQTYQKCKQEYQDKLDAITLTTDNFNEQILERDRKIFKQERSIKILIDDETSLYERKQRLTEELTLLKKELQQIKTIKTLSILEIQTSKDQKEQGKGNFSTFELIVNSKIKDRVIDFFSLKDLISLQSVSKKLYLAFAPAKVIVPHAIKRLSALKLKEIKLLMYKENEFNTMIMTCPQDILKNTMLKIYDLKINLNEFIGPILKETQTFINGDQFIGATTIRTEAQQCNLLDNLNSFLQQQQQSYTQALQSLKSGGLPWNNFFGVLLDNTPTLVARAQLPQKFQIQSQQIVQRLFELSQLCSNDAGIFGMYLSQLQRIVAQLFVFAQHLSIETAQIQSMSYFVMTAYLENLKRYKRQQEDLEDIKEKLNTYIDARTFLNSRLQEMEKIMIEKQELISQKQKLFTQKELLINEQNLKLEQQEKQILKQNDQLKSLAIKTLTFKTKHNELTGEYNDLIGQFQYISRNVNELIYKL